MDAHANAAVVVRHTQGELEHETQELGPQPLASNRPVHRETGEPKHRQGVPWQLPPCSRRQPLDLDMTGGDSREAQNAPVFDGNVRDADMVPELVLARELV